MRRSGGASMASGQPGARRHWRPGVARHARRPCPRPLPSLRRPHPSSTPAAPACPAGFVKPQHFAGAMLRKLVQEAVEAHEGKLHQEMVRSRGVHAALPPRVPPAQPNCPPACAVAAPRCLRPVPRAVGRSAARLRRDEHLHPDFAAGAAGGPVAVVLGLPLHLAVLHAALGAPPGPCSLRPSTCVQRRRVRHPAPGSAGLQCSPALSLPPCCVQLWCPQFSWLGALTITMMSILLLSCDELANQLEHP